MILEYLAAGGGSPVTFTMVAGSVPDSNGNIVGYQASPTSGTLSPSTYKTLTITAISCADYTPYTFAISMPGATNQWLFSRVEIERNGVLERIIQTSSTSFLAGSWIVNLNSAAFIDGQTYTVRLYD